MAWVYMLRSSTGRHYIGSTTDLKRRWEQHCQGHTHSTRRLGPPLELVASLELSGLAEARALERQMKQKKNPRLALFLLEQRRSTLGEQPRN
jgi:predicted GIY-YIG superfamily endonuclease